MWMINYKKCGEKTMPYEKKIKIKKEGQHIIRQDFLGMDLYFMDSKSVNVTINTPIIPNNIQLTSNINQGEYGAEYVLSAIVTDNEDLPINNYLVHFYKNNTLLGTSRTNIEGIAILNNVIVDEVSEFHVKYGDKTSNTVIITAIVPQDIILTHICNNMTSSGTTIFKAVLKGSNNNVMQGKQIQFYKGEELLGSTITDNNGEALFTYFNINGNISITAKYEDLESNSLKIDYPHFIILESNNSRALLNNNVYLTAKCYDTQNNICKNIPLEFYNQDLFLKNVTTSDNGEAKLVYKVTTKADLSFNVKFQSVVSNNLLINYEERYLTTWHMRSNKFAQDNTRVHIFFTALDQTLTPFSGHVFSYTYYGLLMEGYDPLSVNPKQTDPTSHLGLSEISGVIHDIQNMGSIVTCNNRNLQVHERVVLNSNLATKIELSSDIIKASEGENITFVITLYKSLENNVFVKLPNTTVKLLLWGTELIHEGKTNNNGELTVTMPYTSLKDYYGEGKLSFIATSNSMNYPYSNVVSITQKIE